MIERQMDNTVSTVNLNPKFTFRVSLGSPALYVVILAALINSIVNQPPRDLLATLRRVLVK